ncbi:JmjC domain-containing protein [Legionella waltersii]|uniref:Cupin n=1 Tax=Legionella waltersii TaxID=66969 RepID=A0A0W1AMG3_9GAMM|nr:cupin domain-containing protein [Legionella waltersii]KTD82513.1 cupin [Legionella waltersii]SNV02987.1 cupin [Legionella waltersii]
MLNLNNLSISSFLTNYWQKKPLVIRQAFPGFNNPISPDELAGLALEEEIESRLVWETPNQSPQWHLKRGPFTDKDFSSLPNAYWTLLVQGVDRVIPEVYALLDHFNFLPQWRVDDVMISFATLFGGVGPHYDNYDVFLYQAQGKRLWSLTSQQCTPENYIPELELRIMREFAVEEEILLEEGDMLYLPPHIGHYGIAQSDECMTYSFGYRSYQGQELWDSLGDYLSEKGAFKTLYHDPDWSDLKNTSEIPQTAWNNAKHLIQQILDDESTLKSWFAGFVTRLDQSAEQHLPYPLEKPPSLDKFIEKMKKGKGLMRDSACRIAYIKDKQGSIQNCSINGCEWDVADVSDELISLIANHRFIAIADLITFLEPKPNREFLYELGKLQWLQLM